MVQKRNLKIKKRMFMVNSKNYSISIIWIIFLGLSTLFSGCSKAKDDLPKPIANFNIIYIDEIEGYGVIAPSSINFENLSTNANTYHWDFGDGNVSDEDNPSHTFQQKGEYDIKLTAIGEGGENTFSNKLTIRGEPSYANVYKISLNGSSYPGLNEPFTLKIKDINDNNIDFNYDGNYNFAYDEEMVIYSYMCDDLPFDIELDHTYGIIFTIDGDGEYDQFDAADWTNGYNSYDTEFQESVSFLNYNNNYMSIFKFYVDWIE